MQTCRNMDAEPTLLQQWLAWGDANIGPAATNTLTAFVAALPIAIIGAKIIECAAYTAAITGVAILSAGTYLGREEAAAIFNTFASTVNNFGCGYLMPLYGRVAPQQ